MASSSWGRTELFTWCHEDTEDIPVHSYCITMTRVNVSINKHPITHVVFWFFTSPRPAVMSVFDNRTTGDGGTEIMLVTLIRGFSPDKELGQASSSELSCS